MKKSELIKKFNSLFNVAFFFEKEDDPDYMFAAGPSRHAALIDLEKYNEELEFKNFKWAPPNFKKGCVIINKSVGYDVGYLIKAMELFNPDQYAFETKVPTDPKEPDDAICLHLKRDNIDFVLMPRVGKKEHDWRFTDTCDFNDCFMEVGSSAWVI